MDDDKSDSSPTASNKRGVKADAVEAGAAPSASSNSAGSDPNREGRTDNEFVNRVANSLHQTVDELSTAAAPHVQQLQDGIDEIGSQVQEQAGQVRDWGAQCTLSLRASVRDHPLAAIGAAFMVGLLFARLAR